MKKLQLRSESLGELSGAELRAVAGAATSTCSMQCKDTIEDCDRFTYACTALSWRLCVGSVGC